MSDLPDPDVIWPKSKDGHAHGFDLCPRCLDLYDQAQGAIISQIVNATPTQRDEMIDRWVELWAKHAWEPVFRDLPELYEVAKKICHQQGLPWTDPRTHEMHEPPKRNA